MSKLPLSIWKNRHRLIKGKNVVTTPVPSFLIVSSSFLQALRTTINSQMGWKFGQIILWTVELAVLEHLENLHRKGLYDVSF